MELLRTRTRAQHEALEASDWLAAATADLARYAAHLGRVAAFHADAEAALAPHRRLLQASGFAPAERAKHNVLHGELVQLRAAGATIAPAAAGAFPRVETLSAAVGCAYVLEGSTLGGLLIAKTVRERIGWESAFYTGYGSRTAAMWRAFAAAVDALHERLDRASLIAAANATFAAYGRRVTTAA